MDHMVPRKPFVEQGEIIRKARMGLGFTVMSVSESIGIPISHLNRFESGYHKPSMDVASKICDVMELNYEDLMPLYGEDAYREWKLKRDEEDNGGPDLDISDPQKN